MYKKLFDRYLAFYVTVLWRAPQMWLNTTADAVILYSKWNEAEPGFKKVMFYLKVSAAAS
jgi:hypothetical protein